jgi:hypothetical protein
MSSELLRALRPSVWVREIAVPGIILDPWQIRFLDDRSPESRRVLLNIARQLGKSSCVGWLASHHLLHNKGSLVIVAANGLRQAIELGIKIKAGIEAAKGIMTEENKMSFTLTNGARCVILPGEGSSVRSYSSPDLILVDEMAQCDDSLVDALLPMQAVNPAGKFVGLSTPWGRNNHFARFFLTSDTWVKYRQRADENPRIDPAWLANEKRQMIESVFLSEYCCEFTDGVGSVFGYDRLKESLSDEVEAIFQEEDRTDVDVA